jgi:futalosine hydrolase
MILASLKNVRAMEVAGKTIYKGKFPGCDAFLMNTGISKVNAAHSATSVIENFKINIVINFGVGGAYPDSGLEIGDVATATSEIYADEGIAGLQDWKGMAEIGIPLVQQGKTKYFNEFKISLHPLLNTGRWPFGKNTKGSPKIKKGPFVTVSAVSGVPSRAAVLKKLFNAICENMEGAAIAHVCTIYKIPFLEIRGISNMAGVRDKSRWDLDLASANCQKALMKVMELL